MKDNLYDILVELTEINSNVQGMNYILNILKEVYEIRNEMNLFYTVQMFAKFNENLENKLSEIINKMDGKIVQM